jgi:transcription antitermination factor NusG
LSATTTPVGAIEAVEGMLLPASYVEKHWYAAYTCANRERRVAAELETRVVEHFLPQYRSVRRWKGRRVCLDLPLFPGYVFVRLALRDRLQVLKIPGIVRLVGFNGLCAALPDAEIEALRERLSRQLQAEPYPYLTVGRHVRIRSGPFQGTEGILVRHRGKFRLVLSLDLIMRSIAVEVDAADVEPVTPGCQFKTNQKGKKSDKVD